MGRKVAPVGQEIDDLLGEQRIALRLFDDQPGQGFGQIFDS